MFILVAEVTLSCPSGLLSGGKKKKKTMMWERVASTKPIRKERIPKNIPMDKHIF